MLRILFLCTANSARSILAEAILSEFGRGRFDAASAGSQPGGRVNPHALDELARRGISSDGLSSKSWHIFAGNDAKAFDIVITVCDNAASEVCPVWPGTPVAAHWGIPDPAAVTGDSSDISAAFTLAFERLAARIHRLLALDLESMSAAERRQALREIAAEAGRSAPHA